jgi:hypothetical protein
VVQVPLEEVPDGRIDERLRAGETVEEVTGRSGRSGTTGSTSVASG